LSYRSIAAIAAASEEDASMLRAAASLAARFAGHLRVVPAFADPAADLVYYGSVLSRAATAAAVERVECAERKHVEMIGAAARAAAAEFGLAVLDEPVAGASIHVEKRSLNPAAAITNVSVLSDLIVFGAQAASERLALADFFGGALLADRSPILLTRGAHAVLGVPVAIAWDASREAGRAVRAALPILAHAPAIAILQHPRGLTDAQKDVADPARLDAYLTGHGAVKPSFVLAEGAREGEALFAAARAEKCGVLIAGGYGRSRFQEWVLGGATRTFVEAKEGPHLFLCH
jgi:nucleotide-binding universal stress UspA family protein